MIGIVFAAKSYKIFDPNGRIVKEIEKMLIERAVEEMPKLVTKAFGYAQVIARNGNQELPNANEVALNDNN